MPFLRVTTRLREARRRVDSRQLGTNGRGLVNAVTGQVEIAEKHSSGNAIESSRNRIRHQEWHAMPGRVLRLYRRGRSANSTAMAVMPS